uniref:Uncharacterized protein n=1 Tax=Romanomermis culicivorax TaxID=13658 RepID=A0A915K576_ROMCU
MLRSIKQRYTDDPDQLCIGCPVEYRRIYSLLSKYSYYDEPDYRTIAKLLDDTIKRKKLCKNLLLDWQPNSPWKLHADQVANDPMYHEIKRKMIAPSVAAV